MSKVITFKEFGKDYRGFYKCKEVFIKTESEAEEVIYDLYETDNFEFDYENKVVELWYN